MKSRFISVLFLAGLYFQLAGCNAKTQEMPPNPVGSWERRDAGSASIFTRYDFKSDGSFERRSGENNFPQVTRKVAGSWKVETGEAAGAPWWLSLFKRRDPLDELSHTAGMPLPKERSWKRGRLVLRYSVETIDEIPSEAILLAGPEGLEAKRSYPIEENLQLSLAEKTATDEARLIVHTSTFFPSKE